MFRHTSHGTRRFADQARERSSRTISPYKVGVGKKLQCGRQTMTTSQRSCQLPGILAFPAAIKTTADPSQWNSQLTFRKECEVEKRRVFLCSKSKCVNDNMTNTFLTISIKRYLADLCLM